ncbi:MAG: hypothetical protein P1U85_02595 [Verrucomicrobiales bacterium]|nr:hypothetical protein [Verrucomicrobiales bacterium]
MAATSRECPTGGTRIPTAFPGGLCPSCMLAGVVSNPPSETSLEESGGNETSRIEASDSPASEARPASLSGPRMETIKSAFLQFESLTRISENQGHNIYQGPLRFDGRILTLQLVPVGEGDEDELDRKKRSVLGVIEGDFPGCPSWEDSGWIEIDSQPCFFLLSSPDTAISLGKFLREEQPSPERVISIFRKLGERLAPLHAAGFAHLALSPDTIAISSEDVVSFSAQGIGERSARLLNGHLRKGFDATSPYLAPESWEETASGDTRAICLRPRNALLRSDFGNSSRGNSRAPVQFSPGRVARPRYSCLSNDGTRSGEASIGFRDHRASRAQASRSGAHFPVFSERVASLPSLGPGRDDHCRNPADLDFSMSHPSGSSFTCRKGNLSVSLKGRNLRIVELPHS